ncbi:hypothetical protein SISSUDRAFT_133890 [Sistotremastrum suecicum HHB10207 ss-3]|uniref:Uncharacterized protein n=1 Tax=Sistotremastrum suecicum HHB10207 ss-3 TaxID=1314776 RepID=A0A166AWK0_9AGAM|nr:hypothetical protein SISSUDRAFT_133890 [Sistotremastrum suecicum HHB10207 ss-3]
MSESFDDIILKVQAESPAAADFFRAFQETRMADVKVGGDLPSAFALYTSDGKVFWTLWAKNDVVIYNGSGKATFETHGNYTDSVINVQPLTSATPKTFILDSPAGIADEVTTLHLKANGYIVYETLIKGTTFSGTSFGGWY